MTTKVWRRAAMISQNLLLNITGLGIGWSFPCSYARFTATEPSWVLSCPYLLIHTFMEVPSIGGTEPLKMAASVSWSLQAASFLCLTPCSSLPCDPSVSLPPPAVPCSFTHSLPGLRHELCGLWLWDWANWGALWVQPACGYLMPGMAAAPHGTSAREGGGSVWPCLQRPSCLTGRAWLSLFIGYMSIVLPHSRHVVRLHFLLIVVNEHANDSGQ